MLLRFNALKAIVNHTTANTENELWRGISNVIDTLKALHIAIIRQVNIQLSTKQSCELQIFFIS